MTRIKQRLCCLLLLAIFLCCHSETAGADESTDIKIANKLHKLDNFIKRQPTKPPFSEVFERAVWSFKGTPYEGYGHDPIRNEILEIKVDQLGCVSLMEISLALARVAYCGDLSVAAVYKEVQKLRYRHGQVRGFASRLHYFSEWLDQAVEQGYITDRTLELGGKLMQREFNYMTTRPALYPPLGVANNRQTLRQVERDLSQRQYPYLAKEQVAAIEQYLQPGDMVAIVTSQPGIVISHVMMITLFGNERHLIHASSHLQRVATTPMTVSKYLSNSPKRQGLRVVKALPPVCPLD